MCSKPKYDISILTDPRYIDPKQEDINWYVQNILDEDNMVKVALESKGLKVNRINWDDPNYNWSDTAYALFRTTWDYFDRFSEFSIWLKEVSQKTKLINPMNTILWNLDKHYLLDLKNKGINIPPGVFIEKGDKRSLSSLFNELGWDEVILKPAVSGAGRHTYRLNKNNILKHEDIFNTLIKDEAMLIQEYQHSITEKGEVAFMVFGGKFSHAILKKAKQGDFRVQDDFGGTVHDYNPSEKEIQFAEKVVKTCKPMPLYARVDIMWDNNNNICVSELELIEPELWFRKCETAADQLAEAIINNI